MKAKDPSINVLHITGRLTRDWELKYSPSGMAYAKSGIARNGRKKDDPTSFFNLTVFGKTAEFAAQDTRKGSLIYVAGAIDVSDYTDREGNKKRRCDIAADVVRALEWPDDDQQAPPPPAQPRQPTPTQGPLIPEDNDIPF